MIDSPEVAQAYAREHGQIMTFLEPLDWTSAWVGSEYWIGSRAADGAGDWRLDSLTPLRPAVALGVLPRHLLEGEVLAILVGPSGTYHRPGGFAAFAGGPVEAIGRLELSGPAAG